MGLTAHGAALPWSSQGNISEHLCATFKDRVKSSSVSFFITFLLRCHPSSLLVVRHQSGFRHNLWVWFIHQITRPSECLNSKFCKWRGTYKQRKLWSGLGTWGAAWQRFLSGTWFVSPGSKHCRELHRAASGNGVLKGNVGGFVCQICSRNCFDCWKVAL